MVGNTPSYPTQQDAAPAPQTEHETHDGPQDKQHMTSYKLDSFSKYKRRKKRHRKANNTKRSRTQQGQTQETVQNTTRLTKPNETECIMQHTKERNTKSNIL